MTEKSEFISFAKTFENYRWYRPILVMIVTLVMFVIFSAILTIVFASVYGWDFILHMTQGYEVMNTEMGQIFSDLGVIIMLPSLYIAVKIIKDRPFSSYSSSRGGWNHKLYFKALIIPVIIYIIFEAISLSITGVKGSNHFSVMFFIACLILVPLQSIAEEYIFRGLLMQSLGSWFNIPILALLIQAVIFAAFHGYNSLGIFGVFVSGLVMGFFTWKTNGLEVGAALHTVNNLAVAFTVMFGLEMASSTAQLNDVIFSIVIQIVLFAVMYYVGGKTNWFGEIENEDMIIPL